MKKLNGHPSPDKQCDICGIIKENNVSEPRFGYVTCEEHEDIPPSKRREERDKYKSFVSIKNYLASNINGYMKVKYGLGNDLIRFRLIKAYQARNYDGTPSGWKPNTPYGDGECIECKTVTNGIVNYKNYWDIKTGINKYCDFLATLPKKGIK